MARNPIAKSLRSPHLRPQYVPSRKRTEREIREDLADWPEDELGDWHGRNI
jgi:hypothetical protein